MPRDHLFIRLIAILVDCSVLSITLLIILTLAAWSLEGNVLDGHGPADWTACEAVAPSLTDIDRQL